MIPQQFLPRAWIGLLVIAACGVIWLAASVGPARVGSGPSYSPWDSAALEERVTREEERERGANMPVIPRTALHALLLNVPQELRIAVAPTDSEKAIAQGLLGRVLRYPYVSSGSLEACTAYKGPTSKPTHLPHCSYACTFTSGGTTRSYRILLVDMSHPPYFKMVHVYVDGLEPMKSAEDVMARIREVFKYEGELVVEPPKVPSPRTFKIRSPDGTNQAVPLANPTASCRLFALLGDPGRVLEYKKGVAAAVRWASGAMSLENVAAGINVGVKSNIKYDATPNQTDDPIGSMLTMDPGYGAVHQTSDSVYYDCIPHVNLLLALCSYHSISGYPINFWAGEPDIMRRFNVYTVRGSQAWWNVVSMQYLAPSEDGFPANPHFVKHVMASMDAVTWLALDPTFGVNYGLGPTDAQILETKFGGHTYSLQSSYGDPPDIDNPNWYCPHTEIRPVR